MDAPFSSHVGLFPSPDATGSALFSCLTATRANSVLVVQLYFRRLAPKLQRRASPVFPDKHV